jgi:hypothetical protein
MLISLSTGRRHPLPPELPFFVATYTYKSRQIPLIAHRRRGVLFGSAGVSSQRGGNGRMARGMSGVTREDSRYCDYGMRSTSALCLTQYTDDLHVTYTARTSCKSMPNAATGRRPPASFHNHGQCFRLGIYIAMPSTVRPLRDNC